MLRRALLIAVMAAFALPLPAQEEKNLTFNFKDASVDVVLKYVSSVTGWNFTFEPGAKTTGTVTALSQTEVPLSKCLDFLNSALRQHGLVILNPYSPGLPKQGDTLKVLDVSKASGRSVEIHVGSDPDAIPLTDQFRTQIIPLKAVNVVEVNKELGAVLQKAMGEGSTEVAISTYSNSIIMTGRCEGINRAARILRVIDVSASAELKVRVFGLKNADALETAKTLNEVFKKETMRADTGRQNPMEGFMRMMGGGNRGGGEGGAAGPSARALAHEMVRITAEQRTNSVIVSATEDNMKLIEDLIRRLDDKSAAVIKLKLYALRYADATTTAKLVNDLFSDTPTNSSSSQNRGGGGRNPQLPVWMGGQGGAQGGQDQSGATHDVRAVPDVRTNSVLCAASDQKILLIDAVMLEIDRQVNDMLIVKIYELKNADPVQMTTILQSLFRPQVTATQNAGRSTGGGGQQNQGGGLAAMMGVGGGGGNRGSPSSASQLLPSQEIDITNDPRTRSVIVKASREYIAVVDEVVKQLDANPTEAVSTFTYRMKNNDATTVGPMIQNLVRGTGSSTTGLNSGQTRTGQQGQGLFGGMQNQNQGQGAGTGSGNTQGGGTRSSAGTSSTRGRNLGPLDPQDPPLPVPQGEDDLPRRGIEGQVDVQADPTTNMLVIRTSPRNFQSLQGVLEELDRARPQVLIKVLIADVTLDHNTQFGLEGFWEDAHNMAGKKTTVNLGTDFNLPTTGMLTSFSNSVAQGHLNALAKEGKLRVLATPRILALDNQPALINVGKQVPRITNSQINQLGNTVNSVTYEDIGIQLLVTPHINPDGLVTMVVEPEVSDVASASESVAITEGVNNPTFNVNRASTTVAVRNGTTVVIGGLIRETTDDSVEKVPILGDIPLLGLMFSNTSKKKVKRELMIFLTPYVAYTQAQLEEITELERSRLKAIDPRDIDAESDRWLERVRR